MPAPQRSLLNDEIVDHVRTHVFGTASCAAPAPGDGPPVDPRHAVGVELEWLTRVAGSDERVALDQVEALVADRSPLPRGSRVTIEPGGQVELSSACFASAADAIDAVATDLFVLDTACADRGIDLVALGADPVRGPERVVDAPRYTAMETFFDVDNHAGRTMMCNTAAIQLNIGLGEPEHTADRWRLANELGPVLIACFANSPLSGGTPSGWQSSRLRAWWTLDPSRSSPVPLDGDPAARWAEYALDARVMLIRHGGGDFRPVLDGLTFRSWATDGYEGTYPTIDDLAYHLTTLFPPVRPKGWFELRMVDALPTPFWHVAVAVTAALLTDTARYEATREAVGGTTGLWVDAAQLGLGHPALARAARDVFALAIEALAAAGDEANAELAAHYASRWVGRGRAPADDRIDAWRATGELHPPASSPIPAVRLAEVDP